MIDENRGDHQSGYRFPVYVAEGTSSAKLSRINEGSFLCIYKPNADSLAEINRKLFIFPEIESVAD